MIYDNDLYIYDNDFSNHLTDDLNQIILGCGPVLFIVGCLAASLATSWDASSTPCPSCDNLTPSPDVSPRLIIMDPGKTGSGW